MQYLTEQGMVAGTVAKHIAILFAATDTLLHEGIAGLDVANLIDEASECFTDTELAALDAGTLVAALDTNGDHVEIVLLE